MLFFKCFKSSLSISLSHIHIVRCIMYTWYNLCISHAYAWLRFEDAVHVFRFVWYHYPTLFCWEGPSACDFYWVECWLHFGPSLPISWSRLTWAVTRGNIVLLSPKQPQNNQSPASPKAEEEIKTPPRIHGILLKLEWHTSNADVAGVDPEFFRPSTSSRLINFLYYLSRLMLGFLWLENQSLLTYKAFLVGKPSSKARREMDSRCKLKKSGQGSK